MMKHFNAVENSPEMPSSRTPILGNSGSTPADCEVFVIVFTSA